MADGAHPPLAERQLHEMQARAEEASALLKAMANPHRLRVLCALVGGEHSVGELMHTVGLSQSALSQHLATLRHERLVATRREAQTVHYRLAPGPATEIIALLHQSFCATTPAGGARGGAGARSGR